MLDISSILSNKGFILPSTEVGLVSMATDFPLRFCMSSVSCVSITSSLSVAVCATAKIVKTTVRILTVDSIY